MTAEDHFGCDFCWPSDANLAYQALSALEIISYLIDESHYIVTTRSCPNCSQIFLTVFTELVDYIGGEDPQHRIVIPITADELVLLTQNPSGISQRTLESIGAGRRSHQFAHPSGQSVSVYWGTGVQVYPHH
jgi:hypothetical protein